MKKNKSKLSKILKSFRHSWVSKFQVNLPEQATINGSSKLKSFLLIFNFECIESLVEVWPTIYIFPWDETFQTHRRIWRTGWSGISWDADFSSGAFFVGIQLENVLVFHGIAWTSRRESKGKLNIFIRFLILYSTWTWNQLLKNKLSFSIRILKPTSWISCSFCS